MNKYFIYAVIVSIVTSGSSWMRATSGSNYSSGYFNNAFNAPLMWQRGYWLFDSSVSKAPNSTVSQNLPRTEVPGATTGLAETPPDYFPKKLPGLQQAFRIMKAQSPRGGRICMRWGQSQKNRTFRLPQVVVQMAGMVAVASGFMSAEDKTKLDGFTGSVDIYDVNATLDTADATATTILSWTPTDQTAEAPMPIHNRARVNVFWRRVMPPPSRLLRM